MRILALGLGSLLLLGGGTLVVLADQERQAAIDQANQTVSVLEQQLDSHLAENLTDAETLTSLRSAIAEQEAQLADAEGFLE